MNKRMEWYSGRTVSVCLLAALGLALAAETGGQRPAPKALSPSEIVALAEHLQKDAKASKPARQALVSRIEAQYLRDAAMVLSVSPKQWSVLAACLGKEISAERRGRWVSRLRSAFAGRAMNANELAALGRALDILGDGKASDFIAAVMVKTEGWQPLRSREIGILGLELRGDSDGVKAARRKLATVLVQLAKVGLVYDRPTTDHRSLGVAIGTEDVRKLLESELIDDKSRPQMALAGVLGWMYHKANKAKVWNDLIAAKVAAAKDGDTKAMWLMVRAYSASIRGDVIQPQLGRPWLTSAMGAAKSQDVRLLAVHHFMRGYYQSNQRLIAIKFLQSVKEQFSGDARKQIDSLQQRLRAELTAYLTMILAHVQSRAAYQDGLAARTEDESRKKLLRKWGDYFRKQERELLGRLVQIEQ